MLGAVFGLAWLCVAALFLAVVRYRSQNTALKQLVAALQAERGRQIEAQLLLRRGDEEALKASRSADFLSWKMLLTEELRNANARLSELLREQKGLKAHKELANLLYYSLGLTFTAGSDFSAARRCFTEALAYDPRDAESCYDLGALYNFAGGEADLKKAAEYYERYLALAPDGRRSEEVRQRLSALKPENAGKR